MTSNKKSILTVLLLVLVLVFGGTSIYLATRLSTQKPVAPTAPESKPKAGISCSGEGGTCTVGTACPAGKTAVSGADCDGGYLCCKSDWIACSTINFSVACEPRPACLDDKTPCSIKEPASGWCPYLSCDQKKRVFYDDARNVAGTYYLDKEIPKGGTVYQGQVIVFAVPYTNVSNKKVLSAKIEDTLDPRLTFKDADNGCTVTSNSNKVICNIGEVVPGKGSQVAIRALVKKTATLGELLNSAIIETKDLSEAQCHTELAIKPEPKATLLCVQKSTVEKPAGGTTTTLASVVTSGKKYDYQFELENKGDKASTDFVLKDILKGEGRDFVDFASTDSTCTYNETSRVVTCPVALAPAEKKTISFSFVVSNTAPDGQEIKNKATIHEVDGVAATVSDCSNTITVNNPNISALKKAYLDNTSNTAGNYTLSEEITKVSRNQTFVYSIAITNDGLGKAVGVEVTDNLSGEGQDALTFVDSDSVCAYTADSRTVSCKTDVESKATKKVSFRVKVSDTIANGVKIKNVGTVKLGTKTISVKKDLDVSSVVSCNQGCNSDSECSSGLWCDTTANKCRKKACTNEVSCECPATATPTPTATWTPTATRTPAPTRVPTAAPTEEPIAEAPTEEAPRPTAVKTPRPTRVPTAAPEDLPEAGIFDTPGVAILGGGLVLAVIGILLAL